MLFKRANLQVSICICRILCVNIWLISLHERSRKTRHQNYKSFEDSLLTHRRVDTVDSSFLLLYASYLYIIQRVQQLCWSRFAQNTDVCHIDPSAFSKMTFLYLFRCFEPSNDRLQEFQKIFLNIPGEISILIRKETPLLVVFTLERNSSGLIVHRN